MNLYAESSAVLAWLLGEKAGGDVAADLSAAESVLASGLTLVECDRALIRAVATGRLAEAPAIDRRGALNRAAVHWHLIHLADEVYERARRAFPVEPLRTLDALHLSLALFARVAVPDLAVLSLDRGVRENARSLGFQVAPDDAP